ncbi:MAG: hypothetical protein C4576_26040 [Desulfobacteraceae bacterium]|nr:MAG: hypothetical protein C4576_26040 [Desulfobacteraceae bacterium]
MYVIQVDQDLIRDRDPVLCRSKLLLAIVLAPRRSQAGACSYRKPIKSTRVFGFQRGEKKRRPLTTKGELGLLHVNGWPPRVFSKRIVKKATIQCQGAGWKQCRMGVFCALTLMA